MAGAAGVVQRGRGQDVLPTGGGRVAVVDHDGQVVALVEHRVGDAAGQAVVPEAAVAHHGDGALAAGRVQGRGAGAAQAVAHGGVAQVERRQDREQVAADVGAHMVLADLALDQLHRGEDRALRAAGAEAGRARMHALVDQLLRFQHFGCHGVDGGGGRLHQGDHLTCRLRFRQRFDLAVLLQEGAQPLEHGRSVVFASERQQVLAMQRRGGTGHAQDVGGVLLDKVGLAFFQHQHRALARAEAFPLRIDQRVGHVRHVQGDLRLAEHVGQAELLQCADQRVVAAALHGDADVVHLALEELIELAFLDELHGGGPALLDLLVLVHEARRGQHDAAEVARGIVQRVLDGELGAAVVGSDELAMYVA
ncbi:hypothetical protein D9M72_391120 [compost metagenome]